MTVDLISRLRESHKYTSIFSKFGSVVLSKWDRTFTKEERDYIEAKWLEVTAANPGRFTGGKITGVDVSKTFLDSHSLKLAVYPVEFSNYFTTINSPDTRVWVLGVSGIVELCEGDDKYIIFGKRQQRTLNVGGSIESLPGGFVTPNHFASQDPTKETLFGELEEEAGIAKKYVVSAVPFLIGNIRKDPLSGKSFQDVCLIYRVVVGGLSRDGVRQLFETGTREHSELYFVPVADLERFISENFDDLGVRTRFCFEYYLKDGSK